MLLYSVLTGVNCRQRLPSCLSQPRRPPGQGVVLTRCRLRSTPAWGASACFVKHGYRAQRLRIALFFSMNGEAGADADYAEEAPKKRPSQASTSLVDWSVFMSTKQQRVITTRVFRAGEPPPEDDWIGLSVAERIDAVWELTRQCLAWNQTGTDEPRLQRSVSRVQRPSR
jgi:hypothetical protein